MNYIKSLESQIEEKNKQLAAAKALVTEFRSHLLTPKFQGTDPDGARKDWMGTTDIDTRLSQISQALS